MKPPKVMDPARVGTYQRTHRTGGHGHVFDEVLEYRVWYRIQHDQQVYRAFGTYEEADSFSKQTPRAEPPLALVLQREWIVEYVHRHPYLVSLPIPSIVEWSVESLTEDRRRTPENVRRILGDLGT